MALLGLQPLAREGGFFTETYRSPERLPEGVTDSTQGAGRSLATAIYYLLTPETFSAMHRLPWDEIYHFYGGDPVELLQLSPDGSGKVSLIGGDLLAGMQPQMVVPRGTWQGSRLRRGGRYALMGTTMAPGFDPSDCEFGDRRTLLARYPALRTAILALTPA